MSKKASSFLPKMEILIIGVFFLSFLIWAVSKCGTTRDQLQAAAETEVEEAAEYEASVAETPAQSAAARPDSTPTRVSTRTIREQVTPLYITIDGMNVRSEPRLSAPILDRLKLFDEVTFLNEVTDFTEEINLGKETANDPWVKVKTQKGKVGWIYGAGVHYYKWKHPGVE